MKVIQPYCFSLNSYLHLAENHYVEGRYLWLSNAFNGAGNLLWLSFEQIIKLLIVQHLIENNLIENIKIKEDTGRKIEIKFDKNERRLRLRSKVLDSLFYNIDSKHNPETLLSKLKETTNIELIEFNKCIYKINEYFKRRYVVNESSSISPIMLNDIDKLFFYLRGFISNEMIPSFIDDIFFRKKYNIKEPIAFYNTLFLKNNSIEFKQYFDTIDRLPDGRIIAHNGLKYKEFPKESYETLLKKGYLIQHRFHQFKMIE